MDEFLESILSTSSWSDVNSADKSSWVGTAASQMNSINSDPLGTYSRSEQNPSQAMGGLRFNESDMHILGYDTSIFVSEGFRYGTNGCLFSVGNHMQQDVSNHISLESQCENQIHERRYSLPVVMENDPAAGSFGVQRGSVGSSDNDPSAFPQSIEDSQSTSADPHLWQSSYSSVPSIVMDQVNLQNIGLHGEFGDTEADVSGKGCIDGELLKQGAFPVHVNEHKEMHNPGIPSFTSGTKMNMTCMFSDYQIKSQLSEENPIQYFTNDAPITEARCLPTNANGSTGSAKPRTRARRGQATDPHSIAERLRREKITERMKNLQELVPNSNKAYLGEEIYLDSPPFNLQTDKASMLDEIINYVKFLQLQVKVLSMSRLGAAGAVVPLITDIKSEGATSLLLSPSVELGGADPSELEDNLAFEKEVVKLLESNITTAMQILQTKGLCLMPTALAAAISSRKGSCTAIAPGERKPDASHDVVSQSNEPMMKEKNVRQELPRSYNGTGTKQQDSHKSSINVKD